MSNILEEDIYWSCTTALRWLIREEMIEEKFGRIRVDTPHTVKVLQQQWMGDKGGLEWRDVPTTIEDK